MLLMTWTQTSTVMVKDALIEVRCVEKLGVLSSGNLLVFVIQLLAILGISRNRSTAK